MTLQEIVRQALEEDVGTGDVTTNLCVPEDARAIGHFIAREPLVVSGLDLLPFLFPSNTVPRGTGLLTCASRGDEIATVSGPARQLLTHERVALNFLQRLSGI